MIRNSLLTFTAIAICSLSLPAFAEEVLTQMPASEEATVEEIALSPMDQDIAALQTEWAHIKYQMSDKDQQLDAIHALEAQAETVTATYPNNAEPKIWEGIILSTDAGIVKGISALGKVNKAKELFEASLALSPEALNGSAHTSLGSLYYQVPGWPVSFGDSEEAEKHLKHALRLNPEGIDPNYFYGDMLLQNGRYEEAKTYLDRALMAPDRPGRELADAGRRQEIKAALAQIDQKLKDKGKSGFN